MAEDIQLSTMILTESPLNAHESMAELKTSPTSEQEVEQTDVSMVERAVATFAKRPPSKQPALHDVEQKVKVMHEILDRKLKKAEEQKSYLFQERANKRRSFNSLRRSLSSNNKSELGDETTLEQMRKQLEALREEKDHVEDEIVKTQERLSELQLIKQNPEEKASRLDELCTLVTKEFASRRKPSFEA